MATEKEHITASGGRARRFREIRDELEAELGYEPSRPEVLGRLMEYWPPDEYQD